MSANKWWSLVPGDPQEAPGLALNPALWTLVVDQDFTIGNNPNLLSIYCGQEGSVDGANTNNFSPENVYWQNGVLVLKLQNGTNTSCTGVTRPYAGAGFTLNVPAATSMAAEFEIMTSSVKGSAPYAGLFPSGAITPSCGWGSEDDFFEPNSGIPTQLTQTYHFWSPKPACVQGMQQIFSSIPTIATAFHSYSVIRDSSVGGTEFFVDGQAQKNSSGQLINTSDFFAYPVQPAMGLGTVSTTPPNSSLLPAYVYVRHIKVWYKAQ